MITRALTHLQVEAEAVVAVTFTWAFLLCSQRVAEALIQMLQNDLTHSARGCLIIYNVSGGNLQRDFDTQSR